MSYIRGVIRTLSKPISTIRTMFTLRLREIKTLEIQCMENMSFSLNLLVPSSIITLVFLWQEFMESNSTERRFAALFFVLFYER